MENIYILSNDIFFNEADNDTKINLFKLNIINLNYYLLYII